MEREYSNSVRKKGMNALHMWATGMLVVALTMGMMKGNITYRSIHHQVEIELSSQDVETVATIAGIITALLSGRKQS